MKYKLLSLKNKKDLIQIFLYATSLAKALNLEDPSPKTFELERESASEYLLREYDRPLLETIAYPIFCERFLGTPENNSKAAFLSTIKILTKSKIFSLNQGMGSLANHLMKWLNIRFRSPVLKVRPLGMVGVLIRSISADRIPNPWSLIASSLPSPCRWSFRFSRSSLII